ncbi:MAG: hypothetical protein ABSF47_03495, partial [Minisyncoccia bacterium]
MNAHNLKQAFSKKSKGGQFKSNIRKILAKSFLVVLLSLFATFSLARAGSLTPSATPASTMNSLSDVYNAVAGTFDSSAVTPSATGTLIQNLKYIVNNIMFASSSGNATLANMDINIVTGGLELATTTRISNSGQATLTTSTISSLTVSGTSTFTGLLAYTSATGTSLFGSGLVFATGTFSSATST